MIAGPAGPLAGWRVLIPRGGDRGEEFADLLRDLGARPTVAPLIGFAAPADATPLDAALDRLAAGHYDWLLLTSATTVDALAARGAQPATRTRVAVVGDRTADAARLAGYRVDLVPTGDHSAQGMLRAWPATGAARALLPVSDLADSTLSDGLARLGVEVDRVIAYRSVPIAAPEGLAAEVADGGFRAILVTAGSVAARLAAEFPVIPGDTLVVCIGPRTADATRAVGLPVHAIAAERNWPAMADTLTRLARGEP